MILKSDLKLITNSQNNHFNTERSSIFRDLTRHLRNDISELIIINGLKRTGKTTVLFQLSNRNSAAAFYINFEHPGLYGFDQNDFFKLDEIIAVSESQTLLFDGITSMDGWQSYVRQKLDDGFKVVLTTSNADVLNNEWGTGLTGRYTNKVLMPLAFTEYCAFHSLEKNENTLRDYMKAGGFPVKATNNEEYLSQLFDDIVVREIGVKNGIRDLRAFKRLSLHLLRHIGEMITANHLKGVLGIKTTTTVMDYLNYLEAGFLMYFLPKFSYSVRKQMVNPRKVYVADTGFVNAATVNTDDKQDQLLENLVFLHLKSKYTELYYFSEDGQCDFIGFGKDQAQIAVQVCARLESDNLEKELNGLTKAMDFFEFSRGTVVTFNQTDTFIRDGKTIDVVSFVQYVNQK